MKCKLIISIIIISSIIVLFSNNICLGKDKRTISTAEELKNFALEVNGGNSFEGETIYLMNDIDLEGNEENQWTPIGSISKEFKGTFDGDGHVISGIYIEKEDLTDAAFFNENSGVIKNLGVRGTIRGRSNIAGLCANNSGTISHCFSDVDLSSEGINIGGIAAWNGHARY